MKGRLYFIIGFLMGFSLVGFATTQTCPLSGQYHPLSEICIDTDLNMQGKNIINVGKLGIGTSSPSEKLEIVGNVKVSGTIILPDSGTLFKTNNEHVRITFHDGCGEFQIMAGAYGCPNKYVQNSGAAKIEMQYNNTDGAIFLRVAPIGNRDQQINWITYSFKINEFNSPEQIKAPKFVDRDNTSYFIDPSGNSKVKNIYVETLCLNPDCTAKIYWDGNSLVIEAPNIIIAKTT